MYYLQGLPYNNKLLECKEEKKVVYNKEKK